MASAEKVTEHWSRDGVEVRILYSVAAVATQILIKGRGTSILVDAGDGALRDLLSLDLAPAALEGILLTHGHYDHVGGLYSLLGYMKMKKRRKLLPVLLPRGSRAGIGLAASFSELSSGSMPFQVDTIELSDGDCLTLGAFRIDAAGVAHCFTGVDGVGVPMPALGYRVSWSGTTVAITGDCGDSAGVRELVRGADLAIIEASLDFYASDWEKRVHLTEELADEIGSLAEKHILVHRPIGRRPGGTIV